MYHNVIGLLPRTEFDDPHSLLVLTEEELVGIDLQTEGWPQFQLPYFNSLHSSAITCTAHVNNVPDAFWTKIVDAGEPQLAAYSTRVSTCTWKMIANEGPYHIGILSEELMCKIGEGEYLENDQRTTLRN